MPHAARLTPDDPPLRRPVTEPSLTEMSAAGLRAFFKIARDWDLSTEEQIILLGSPGRSTFFKWKKDRNRKSSMSKSKKATRPQKKQRKKKR